MGRQLTRRLAQLGAACGLLLALAATLISPAAAGGWAVTSLDHVPAAIVAGETTRVGFTILQHGRTPAVGMDSVAIDIGPLATATRFPARAEGAAGHYVADIVVPTAGAQPWRVIQGWFGPHELGTIDVVVAGSPPVSTSGLRTSLRWALPLVSVAAIVVGLASLRRRQPAPAT